MSYGVNGSVIGPENAPTSSSASGVWSLSEVAEAVRDSAWPAPPEDYEVIEQYLGDSTSTVITFNNIPQNYRHLRIIMGPAWRDAQGASVSLMFNNDNTQANYGMWGARDTGNWALAGGAGQNNYNHYGDLPTYNHGTFGTFDIPGYSNPAIGGSMQSVMGARIFGGSIGGIFGFAGLGYDQAAAITRIDIFYMYGTGTNYDYKAPTSVTLFGIGTAD